MIARRLVALLTAVALLHLGAAVDDPACATHRHGAAGPEPAAHQATPMDAHSMAAHASSAVSGMYGPTIASPAPLCVLPVQQHCCYAAMGCSTASALVPSGQRVAAVVGQSAHIGSRGYDAPPSFSAAPEPPPPRA